ncbi:Hsp70 family protein [Amycolatopsis anabasis]|uniref:Hsp70 family protein n=1 Tax=Amycolatopsis anabasis TaxID=1840409 RepID=UPI0031B5F037
MVPLAGGARWIDTVLHVAPDGAVLAGQAVRRYLNSEPERLASGFLAQVGDPVPLVLGEDRYLAEALAATFAGWVADLVTEAEGGPAERIVLTHPAAWGPHRRGALYAALDEAGLPGVLLLPSPVAAAELGIPGERLDPGAVLAVCRIGGEHVESAVLRRAPAGFELLARAENAVPRAGNRIDDLLVEYVLAEAGVAAPEHTDPDARTAMGRVRAACVEAKERLSLAPEAIVPVPFPGGRGEVRLTRPEFEHLARPVLTAAVAQLRRLAAPVPADRFAGAVLVGGSARIPLVAELAEEALNCRVLVDHDPGTAVARGAALAGLPRMAPETDRDSAVSTALATRDSGELARVEEDELGPPPPRPPVEVTPLDPPKRFALSRKGGNRTEERDEDSR